MTQLAEHWFFLYGFRKNKRANIDKDELRALQTGDIMEVKDGDEEA